MKLTRELVRKTYLEFLGREPESEEVVEFHCSNFSEFFDFFKSIIRSAEFKSLTHPYIKHHDYRGYNDRDVELLMKYEDYNRRKINGYLVNYFGVKTDKSFLPQVVQAIPDQAEGIPIPMNFLSEAAEWLGVIESIDSASNTFVALELGAGWGPWTALCGVICQRIKLPFRLVAVEGDAEKVGFISKNFSNNFISESNYRIINAVVGDSEIEIDFPILRMSSNDYGISIDKQGMGTRANVVGFRKTPQVTIASLIKEFDLVDLIHIDIQGHEFRAISHSIKFMNENVRFIVIGTHSRKLEGDLFELLWKEGWKLVREKPSIFDLERGLDATIDGIQVWSNGNL